jgi:hypothetical protein
MHRLFKTRFSAWGLASHGAFQASAMICFPPITQILHNPFDRTVFQSGHLSYKLPIVFTPANYEVSILEESFHPVCSITVLIFVDHYSVTEEPEARCFAG